MWVLLWILLAFILIHAYMSLRYNYDWIGSTTKRAVMNALRGSGQPQSVTEMFDIPQAPYADRFGTYTRVPKMKGAGM